MSNTTPNWDAKQADLVSELPVQKLNKLTDDWNVSTETPLALGTGWDPQENAYTFPEYDGSHNVIGIMKRDSETGAKKMYFRSQRGLSYPTNWNLTEDQPILIPEGVSDTAALHNLGLNAIGRPSNTGGVEHLAELLDGCPPDQEIIVLGENDQKDDSNWPGRVGAIRVASKLQKLLGRPVKCALPPPNYKDVREYVDALRASGEEDVSECVLSAYLGNAQAVEESETDSNDDFPTFQNFEWFEDEDGKRKRRGRTAEELLSRHERIIGEFPVSVGDTLYFVDDQNSARQLDSPTKLFAYMDSFAKLEWSTDYDSISQSRYYELQRLHCPSFDAIEQSPHFPSFKNIYYVHPPLPEPTGEDLETLIDYFTPETPEDRQLLMAFVLTLFWGGECGSRPLFLFTGPSQDPEPEKNGKGVGKSTVVQLLGELAGGLMSFAPDKIDFSKITTRLLSPGASQLRVCLIDNLKSHRFSCADLEALITSPTVSGHRMFIGEGQRPNTLVWAITVNGATLSGDLAERCVVIRLARPEHNPEWRSNVSAFIRDRRWNIIADIQALLLSENEEDNYDE